MIKEVLKKIRKTIRNNLQTLIGFFIGLLFVSTAALAITPGYLFDADMVTFSNATSGLNSNFLQGAIDEISATCPNDSNYLDGTWHYICQDDVNNASGTILPTSSSSTTPCEDEISWAFHNNNYYMCLNGELNNSLQDFTCWSINDIAAIMQNESCSHLPLTPYYSNHDNSGDLFRGCTTTSTCDDNPESGCYHLYTGFYSSDNVYEYAINFFTDEGYGDGGYWTENGEMGAWFNMNNY